MRVLVVTSYYKPAYVYGGPTKSVSQLCESLVRSGTEVLVLTTDANGRGRCLPVGDGSELMVDGVHVRYYHVNLTVAHVVPFYSPALARACWQNVREYDVVYLPSTWTHPMWSGARSAFAAGIPYIVSPRGSFMDWSLKQKPVKKRLYLALVERRLVQRAAAIHATTMLEARQQEKLGFRTPTWVIPNGMDVQKYDSITGKANLRDALGLTTDSLISLFVGRLHRMKRLDVMVEAFFEVAEREPKSHLVIAGPNEGDSQERLKHRAAQLGLSARVHFLGLVEGDEVVRLYRDADVVLLISYRENFGMVLLEAMACEKPVIVSDQVGLADEIGRAGAGLIVAGGANELAPVWIDLLKNHDLRSRMGKQGRQLVCSRFAIENVTAEMLQLFQDVSTSRERRNHRCRPPEANVCSS